MQVDFGRATDFKITIPNDFLQVNDESRFCETSDKKT
jgi:hypothetical protein